MDPVTDLEPAVPAFDPIAQAKPKGTIRIDPSDLPDLTIARMTQMISPESLLQTLQAPGAIPTCLLAAIESEEN